MIRQALGFLFLAALPSWAPCAEPRAPELPSVASVLAAVNPQPTGPIRVSMEIRSVFGGDQYDISDTMSRIQANVSRDPGGKSFRFSGNVDNRYLTGTVETTGYGYQIWGGGLNVEMRKWGTDNYEISGWVDEADGSKSMRVTLRPRGFGNFDVWDNGVNLTFSKFASNVSVSGEIDPRWFGKNCLTLTSVFVAVIEAQLDKPTPQPAAQK